MILEKKQKFSADVMNFVTLPDNVSEELLTEVLRSLTLYRGAMMIVNTKLEIVDDEFRMLYDYNPIHHMECRLKNPSSIFEKMRRKGIQFSFEAIKTNVLDIAGTRVVCNYIDDVYKLTSLILSQPDVKLIRERDYIKEPKSNGYRSIHLVISIPVYLSGETQYVPVEIQLRTIAMDMWASLEHELYYKTECERSLEYVDRLKRCAIDLSDIDLRMQDLYNIIESTKKY